MTTTQITTLEQAEIALYRANAVQQYNNQPMVEGKQLLDICGFSYTDRNWGHVLNRQFDRHSFVEGTDYFRTLSHTNVGQPGRPAARVHITINAANHILLAAMTPQGQEARQEAIDLQNSINESDPVVFALMNMARMRSDQLRLEQTVTEVQQQVSVLDNRVETEIASVNERIDARGCRAGYILRSDAYRKHHRGLSKRTFEELLIHGEVPSEGIMLLVEGAPVNTVQVHEQSVIDLVAQFYSELEQVSPLRFKHSMFGNRTFQA